VRELALRLGFQPVERGTGGRLTMFDEGSLAITLLWPQAEPHAQTLQRYETFSGAIADALVKLGIEAKVGELPQEYCPGKYSINAAGRVKLVGVAQRMTRHCVQMGAIIAVERSNSACEAISAAYHAMGLPFDPETYGAIKDLQPSLSYEEVSAQMVRSVSRVFNAS
jgi:lipoate-protein ligase A